MERARELAAESPVLPELLEFYGQIARFQSSLAEGAAPANLEELLALIRRTVPEPDVRAKHAGGSWNDRLRGADRMHAFFVRVVLQANGGSAAGGPASPGPSRCPRCAEKPVAAVLRPEGEGAERFLLCSLCFTEWRHYPNLCPNCEEPDRGKLRIYTTAEFPHIHLELCGTCRVYLKAIDLTINGRAVPEVDELASVVLDLWAAEQGYTKLQSNLFGM